MYGFIAYLPVVAWRIRQSCEYTNDTWLLRDNYGNTCIVAHTVAVIA